MGTQNERQPQTYRARPEPGQLVEVRRRQWVVADVDAAGLETGVPQHCVTLSSMDEDGLGEELGGVWQLEPLVRAIDMARVNLLIAADVGLGKTIEAGLVIQELLLRHRARTVLIVCPASLQEKWRVEMLEKFGLDFRVVDT